jgi:crossover junction endodeoxyribonuclease RuvC
MKVLGIDPGSRFLGYGVVEQNAGKLRHLGHGVVKTSSTESLEQRLVQIFDELSFVIQAYKPDAVAVEGVFTFKNVRSALVLGQARGVALLVSARSGLSVSEYSPAKVKRAVGAGGASDKASVARMVRTLLHLPELERHDAYDALAVAICHCNVSRFPVSMPRKAGRAVSFEDRLVPNYSRPTGKRAKAS